jgi:hypothetical protein
VWLLIALLILVPTSAQPLEHLRIESRYLRTLLPEIAARSSTIRSLIDRIEHSNVLAYLGCESFTTNTFDARTRWLAARGGVRYLQVQIRCGLLWPRVIALLGHELQHVAEVAAAPGARDERIFGKLFTRIGFRTYDLGASTVFETDAAVRAGEPVCQEYQRSPSPSSVMTRPEHAMSH